LHKDLRTEYAKYAKAFPLSRQLDLRVPSKWYRRSVGGVEIVCGLILMLTPFRRLKNAANIALIIVKVMIIKSH